MKGLQKNKMKDLYLRMDRFDSLITEYLRRNHETVEKLAVKVGCDPSTLWRYRKKEQYFERIPLNVICCCFQIMQVSNENLRYILGLPIGKDDHPSSRYYLTNWNDEK